MIIRSGANKVQTRGRTNKHANCDLKHKNPSPRSFFSFEVNRNCLIGLFRNKLSN